MAESSRSVSEKRRAFSRWRVRVWGPLAALSLGACNGNLKLPEPYQSYLEKLAKMRVHFDDGSGEGAAGTNRRAPAVPATGRPSGKQLTAEQKSASGHAQLLAEMLRVTLMGEPTNLRDFNMVLDTMMQGASVEGLYNGFTHSSNYRKLENHGGESGPRQLRVFSEELEILEKELPEPSYFDAASAGNLEVLDPQEFAESMSSEPGPARSPAPARKRLPPSAENYEKLFAGASVFTLKRVLGDEALKVIAAKKNSPEKLADWYALWAQRLANRGVDFGLPLRNKSDVAFHRSWALAVLAGKGGKSDQLVWEILNRVHRLMNDAARSETQHQRK